MITHEQLGNLRVQSSWNPKITIRDFDPEMVAETIYVEVKHLKRTAVGSLFQSVSDWLDIANHSARIGLIWGQVAIANK